MTLRCLIIDDEPDAHQLLQNYCDKLDFIKVMGHCYNALSAMQFLEKNEIDFLFLDIQMPEISGIEFLKLLNYKPKIIFTTAHSEYALEGYEYHTYDYLLKPIRFERFLKAINKIRESYDIPSRPLPAAVHFDGYERPINPLEIMYTEAYGNYIKIHLKHNLIVVHETMKSVEETLRPYGFIRCHKRYLLNRAEIAKTERKQCILLNGKILPIGISYRQQTIQALKIKG